MPVPPQPPQPQPAPIVIGNANSKGGQLGPAGNLNGVNLGVLPGEYDKAFEQMVNSTGRARNDATERDYNNLSYLTSSPALTVRSGDQEQARRMQQQTIQGLFQAARGDRNSFAQQQLQQGFNQARGGVAALGAARRGVGAGQALRGIGAGQANLSMQQGMQSDMLMAQEKQAAQQQLMQYLEAQRGQDLAMAGINSNQALGTQQIGNSIALGQAGAMAGNRATGQQTGLDMLGIKTGADIRRQENLDRLLMQGIGAGATAAGSLATMNFGPPELTQADKINLMVTGSR